MRAGGSTSARTRGKHLDESEGVALQREWVGSTSARAEGKHLGEGEGVQHLGLEGLLREAEVAVDHQRAERPEPAPFPNVNLGGP